MQRQRRRRVPRVQLRSGAHSGGGVQSWRGRRVQAVRLCQHPVPGKGLQRDVGRCLRGVHTVRGGVLPVSPLQQNWKHTVLPLHYIVPSRPVHEPELHGWSQCGVYCLHDVRPGRVHGVGVWPVFRRFVPAVRRLPRRQVHVPGLRVFHARAVPGLLVVPREHIQDSGRRLCVHRGESVRPVHTLHASGVQGQRLQRHTRRCVQKVFIRLPRRDFHDSHVPQHVWHHRLAMPKLLKVPCWKIPL